MSLSQKILAFTLRQTDDPVKAARMATLLGEAMVDVRPLTSFPPEWVLAQQKSSAPVAAYAVRFCDDLETLATIAFKAKRLTVLRALAANPHLDLASLAWVRKLGEEKGDWNISRAYQTRSAVPTGSALRLTTADVLADPHHYLNAVNRAEVLELIGHNATTGDQIEAIVEAALAVDASWLVCEHLNSKFGWGHSRHSGLATAEVDVQKALRVIGTEQLPEFLTTLVSRALDQYSAFPTPAFDVAMAEQVMTHVNPAKILAGSSKRRRTNAFSPESLDLLLSNRDWLHVVKAHHLTDTQFQKTLELSAPTDLVEMIAHTENSPQRVRSLLVALQPETTLSSTDVATLLTAVTGRHDSLVTELVHRSGMSALTEYLAGRWDIKGVTPVRLMPSTQELPALVERLSELALDKSQAIDARFIMSNITSLRPAPPLEYVHQLIELVPDMAAAAIGTRYEGQVYARLSSCQNIELALEQFSNNPSTPLGQLVRTADLLAG